MTAEARLKADRVEFVRSVDATFEYADEATAAVLRTFIDRLADNLERRQ